MNDAMIVGYRAAKRRFARAQRKGGLDSRKHYPHQRGRGERE